MTRINENRLRHIIKEAIASYFNNDNQLFEMVLGYLNNAHRQLNNLQFKLEMQQNENLEDLFQKVKNIDNQINALMDEIGG